MGQLIKNSKKVMTKTKMKQKIKNQMKSMKKCKKLIGNWQLKINKLWKNKKGQKKKRKNNED